MGPAPASIRLADRRTLSFYDLGDRSGEPVLLFHGTPQAAIGWSFADGPARELGVRALALDRPGIGASTLQPRRTLLSYPRDVTDFAAALGLERFAVLGWSAGGPYALACAAAIPGSLSAVGSVAGACPLDWPGAMGDLNPQDRRIVKLGRRSPAAARAVLAVSALAARHAPGLTQSWTAKQLSAAERRTLDRHRGELADMRFFLDAFEQGARGVAEDYRIYGEPWGFDPAEIAIPVVLWNGDEDSLVPLRHAELLHERIPGSRLEVVEGAGHLLPYDVIAAMLAELTGR